MDTKPYESPITLRSHDDLIGNVVQRVLGLASGSIKDADNSKLSSKCTERPVELTMTVSFSLMTSTTNTTGNTSPERSLHYKDHTETLAYLEGASAEIIAKSIPANDTERELQQNPLRAFIEWKPEFEVSGWSALCHHHIKCSRCSGTAQHRCSNLHCMQGNVRCYCHDGKEQCRYCVHGLVRYEESRPDGKGGHTVHQGQKHCYHCGGSGRSGLCTSCGGHRHIVCRTCAGTGQVDCIECSKTGWFTIITKGAIRAKVDRSAHDTQGITGIDHALKMFVVNEIPVRHAKTMHRRISVSNGTVVALYSSTLRHIEVSMCFDGINKFKVDAYGEEAVVAQMPCFLDPSLEQANNRISQALENEGPANAIQAAQGNRVTNHVLELIAKIGEAPTPAVVANFDDAVSSKLVDDTIANLRKAYNQVGQAAATNIWRFGAPVAVIAAAAFPLFGLAQFIIARVPYLPDLLPSKPGLVITGMNAAFGALPLLIVWKLATRRSRGVARTVVGSNILHRPKQGAWLTFTFASTCAVLTACLLITADSTLLPQRLAALVPGMIRPVLAPSSLPTFQPQTEPTNADVRGIPEIYKVQFLLAQFDIYKGPLNGVEGPETRAAVDEFMRLPSGSDRLRYARQATSRILTDATLDRIRIGHFPTTGTPADELSNIFRAKLSADNIERLMVAVGEAPGHPGAETSWRSVDGKRGGRVRASVVTGLEACASYDIEVWIDGFVERPPLQTWCKVWAQ